MGLTMGASLASAQNSGSGQLYVGAAKRIFTPNPLLPVSGGMGPTRPAKEKRGELVAEALPGPGRHDAQHVPPAEHVLDHLPLGGAEFVQAEQVLQVLAEVERSGGDGAGRRDRGRGGLVCGRTIIAGGRGFAGGQVGHGIRDCTAPGPESRHARPRRSVAGLRSLPRADSDKAGSH